MSMHGGEVLVETLVARGVDTVFFVPGGTYTTVLEALSRNANKIKCVPMRLESSAVFAAEAYAAIRHKPACVMVSRAPGACNASIGIHTAQQGSRPVLLMIANIPKTMKQREAFQEIDYAQMFPAIAKAQFDVHSFDEIAPVVSRCVDLSAAGRPGPVVVSISKDILDGPTGVVTLPATSSRAGSAPTGQSIAEVMEMLRDARHPIVLAGELINYDDANDALIAFAEASGAGVMASYRQQDVFPNRHPAWMGQLTLNRTPHMETALGDCDLLIAVGCRLDSVTCADYTMVRDRHRLVMIYPEPAEFAQWQPEVAISASSRASLEALTAAIDSPPTAARLTWRDQIHDAETAFAQPGEVKVHGAVDMAQVIQTFRRKVPAESVIVSDAGTFGRWVHRYYQHDVPGTCIGPISGAMGFGVPGGIGATIAAPDRPVFVWVGDGGFLMTGNEAAAMVQENLPVKLIVCDNSAWGSIMTHQQKRFPGWDFGTRLKSPDFAALAEGYGMTGLPVLETSQFEPALDAAMAVDGPALIHLRLDIRDISPFVPEGEEQSTTRQRND